MHEDDEHQATGEPPAADRPSVPLTALAAEWLNGTGHCASIPDTDVIDTAEQIIRRLVAALHAADQRRTELERAVNANAYAAVVRDEELAAAEAERTTLRKDLQHCLDTMVPVHELREAERQRDAFKAAVVAISPYVAESAELRARAAITREEPAE